MLTICIILLAGVSALMSVFVVGAVVCGGLADRRIV